MVELRLDLPFEGRRGFLDLLEANNGGSGISAATGMRGGAGASLRMGALPSSSSSSKKRSASSTNELGTRLLPPNAYQLGYAQACEREMAPASWAEQTEDDEERMDIGDDDAEVVGVVWKCMVVDDDGLVEGVLEALLVGEGALRK